MFKVMRCMYFVHKNKQNRPTSLPLGASMSGLRDRTVKGLPHLSNAPVQGVLVGDGVSLREASDGVSWILSLDLLSKDRTMEESWIQEAPGLPAQTFTGHGPLAGHWGNGCEQDRPKSLSWGRDRT